MPDSIALFSLVSECVRVSVTVSVSLNDNKQYEVHVRAPTNMPTSRCLFVCGVGFISHSPGDFSFWIS